ncbi:DUF2953 domain-containing protein [Hominifimenecus sp. rT4P-3]|uniref:DUF2953 domain-containing protein n=1 Tax=Hominifimenecus sp. rT4P-3 TaxID=3242979 RepID=UPI003DA4FD46
MLSVLLTLLKIVGFLILVLLGLVILFLLAVALAPFRYECKAEAVSLKEIKIQGRVSWLLRVVSVSGKFQDGNIFACLRILGIPIFRIPESEKTRRKSARKRRKKELLEEPVFREPTVKESVGKDKKETDSIPQQTEASLSRDRKQEKKKRKRRRKKKGAPPTEGKASKAGWREKLEEGLDFIQNAENQKMFAFLKEQLFAVLRHIRPQVFEIEALVGFDDPATTGTVLGLVYMLYPFYGEHIRVVGEFEEVVLKGRLYLRGRIRILTLLIIGVKIYRNQSVRELLNRRKNDGRQ